MPGSLKLKQNINIEQIGALATKASKLKLMHAELMASGQDSSSTASGEDSKGNAELIAELGLDQSGVLRFIKDMFDKSAMLSRGSVGVFKRKAESDKPESTFSGIKNDKLRPSGLDKRCVPTPWLPTSRFYRNIGSVLGKSGPPEAFFATFRPKS